MDIIADPTPLVSHSFGQPAGSYAAVAEENRIAVLSRQLRDSERGRRELEQRLGRCMCGRVWLRLVPEAVA